MFVKSIVVLLHDEHEDEHCEEEGWKTDKASGNEHS